MYFNKNTQQCIDHVFFREDPKYINVKRSFFSDYLMVRKASFKSISLIIVYFKLFSTLLMYQIDYYETKCFSYMMQQLIK